MSNLVLSSSAIWVLIALTPGSSFSPASASAQGGPVPPTFAPADFGSSNGGPSHGNPQRSKQGGRALGKLYILSEACRAAAANPPARLKPPPTMNRKLYRAIKSAESYVELRFPKYRTSKLPRLLAPVFQTYDKYERFGTHLKVFDCFSGVFRAAKALSQPAINLFSIGQTPGQPDYLPGSGSP